MCMRISGGQFDPEDPSDPDQDKDPFERKGNRIVRKRWKWIWDPFNIVYVKVPVETKDADSPDMNDIGVTDTIDSVRSKDDVDSSTTDADDDGDITEKSKRKAEVRHGSFTYEVTRVSNPIESASTVPEPEKQVAATSKVDSQQTGTIEVLHTYQFTNVFGGGECGREYSSLAEILNVMSERRRNGEKVWYICEQLSDGTKRYFQYVYSVWSGAIVSVKAELVEAEPDQGSDDSGNDNYAIDDENGIDDNIEGQPSIESTTSGMDDEWGEYGGSQGIDIEDAEYDPGTIDVYVTDPDGTTHTEHFSSPEEANEYIHELEDAGYTGSGIEFATEEELETGWYNDDDTSGDDETYTYDDDFAGWFDQVVSPKL